MPPVNLRFSVVHQAGNIVGRTGANHFPNTFVVSLNPMRGCDNYQISIQISRMERVKQLAVLAAALLQVLLLLLPLLLLHLLPCCCPPCCSCCCCPAPTVYAIPPPLLSPAFAVAAPVLPQSFGCASGSILNYNAVAPDPAHRCLNACSIQHEDGV